MRVRDIAVFGRMWCEIGFVLGLEAWMGGMDLLGLRFVGRMERRSSVTLYCVHAELYWSANSAARASCRAMFDQFSTIR